MSELEIAIYVLIGAILIFVILPKIKGYVASKKVKENILPNDRLQSVGVHSDLVIRGKKELSEETKKLITNQE